MGTFTVRVEIVLKSPLAALEHFAGSASSMAVMTIKVSGGCPKSVRDLTPMET